MDESGRDNDNLREPIKPSSRWRGRLLKTAVVLAVFILVLAIIWWYGVAKWDSRLQAQLDEYHAAGQPVYLADFQLAPVVDENNAALALKKAADSINLTEDQEKKLIDFADPEAISQNLDEFAKIVQDNTEVMELVRSSRSMTGAYWGNRMGSFPFYKTKPPFGDQRRLARLLCATAVYRNLVGEDVAAIEIIRDMQSMAKTQREFYLLTSHLSGTAIDSLSYRTIEKIVPDLKASAFVKELTKPLITDLLDEDKIFKAVRRLFFYERALMLETVEGWLCGRQSIVQDTGPSAREVIFAKTLEPFHKRDLVQMMQNYTAIAEAVTQPTWPEAKELLLPTPECKTVFGKYTHVFSSVLMPSLNRLLEIQYRSIAMRRMAAVAMAMRLYELDHGSRPVKLTDLVPDYLPAVPKDPFAADGREINYAPEAARPVLYSIGPNGVDDGGKYAADPNDSPEIDLFDMPFFLNGDRPKPHFPATQPGTAGRAPTSQPASAPGDNVSVEK